MALLDAVPQPRLPKIGCEAILATVVEWRRSPRGLLADELSELWLGDSDLEHGYDASGKHIAERSPFDPSRILVLDHRPDAVAAFVGGGASFVPFALLERHRNQLRAIAVWHFPSQKVANKVQYVDGELGVERILHEQPDGYVIEIVYERGVDGRVVRVVQVEGDGADGERVLWPLPGKAAIARALREVATLTVAISDSVRTVASTSKAGVCVLSFTPEGSYLPPVVSWLPVEEMASMRSAGNDDLWATAEWSHTDLEYLPRDQVMRWWALNDAACCKPRAAEKALMGLSRSIEAELRADGFECVVAALPLEVAEGHERLVKKQVSAHEWTLLRTWGLVR